MKIIPPENQIEQEKAITMLVNCISEECRNEKPLILHSLRVGFKLIELDAPQEAILAGFLHDLIEDTNCKIEDIEKEFGSRVAEIVMALTQEKIEDCKERWQVLMAKIKKIGKEAMVIKIVDANDNLAYLSLIEDRGYAEEMLWKYDFIIEQLGPFLADFDFFGEYKANVKIIKTQLGF